MVYFFLPLLTEESSGSISCFIGSCLSDVQGSDLADIVNHVLLRKGHSVYNFPQGACSHYMVSQNKAVKYPNKHEKLHQCLINARPNG